MMRSRLKRLWNNRTLILILLVLGVRPVSAQENFTFKKQSPPDMEEFIEAREVFEYEVSYGFITLGWIDVELMPDTTYNGESVYHLRTTMRTNNRVPFIGRSLVHYENFFQYNEKWPYSLLFWRHDIHDDEPDRVRIEFDRESSQVHFYERSEYMESLELIEPASGGDIIFYYARMFAGTERSYKMPVYIENEIGYVEGRNSRETELRSYDLFDDSVEVYLSEGDADINGPFGFKGRFKAWFLTDDLRVPVEAHVRVIFGNVKIRLIDYDKQGN